MVSSENSNNSWELGEKLILDSREINTYAANREGEYALRKVGSMLGKLATKYAGTAVYIDGSNLLIPEKEGVGIGPGQMTGEITGFVYGDYATLNDDLDPLYSTGVIMAFEMDKLNDVPAEAAAKWRNVVFPEVQSNRFMVGMPVIPSNRVMELREMPRTPDTVDSLIAESQQPAEEYAYRSYVERIQSLTNGKYYFEHEEGALVHALNEELSAMNLNCPFLNNIVSVKAEYMRRPKQNSEKFDIIRGSIVGQLRKFIYAPIMREGVPKGDVQAVVYAFKVAEAVMAGKMTPREADRDSTTVFVPLSSPHVMLDLENKK